MKILFGNIGLYVWMLLFSPLLLADEVTESANPLRIEDLMLRPVVQIAETPIPDRLRKDQEFSYFVRYLMDLDSKASPEVKRSFLQAYRGIGMGLIELYDHLQTALSSVRSEVEAAQRLRAGLLGNLGPALTTQLKLELGASVVVAGIPNLQLGWVEKHGRLKPLLTLALRTVTPTDAAAIWVGLGVEKYKREGKVKALELFANTERFAGAVVGRSLSTSSEGRIRGAALAFGIGFVSGEGTNYRLNLPLSPSFPSPLLWQFKRLKRIEKKLAQALLQFDFARVNLLLESYRDVRVSVERQLAERGIAAAQGMPIFPTHPLASLQSLILSAHQNQRSLAQKLSCAIFPQGQ